MPAKFLVQRPNIFYRARHFIAHANIFISICAASLSAWSQQLFTGRINFANVWITLGCTFIMYNTQQLYLGYVLVKGTPLFKEWVKKNAVLLRIMMLVTISEIYPFQSSGAYLLLTYAIAGVISFLYFLPFFNLRGIPFLKSLIIGFVWTLICVIAPTKITEWNKAEVSFCLSQLLLVTALSVLFNIRDVEDDKKTKTYTIPVLYGIKRAKIFCVILLAGYVLTLLAVSASSRFIAVSLVIFAISSFFSFRSSPKNHGFYYLYGVDGIILLQSVLGLVFLRS